MFKKPVGEVPFGDTSFKSFVGGYPLAQDAQDFLNKIENEVSYTDGQKVVQQLTFMNRACYPNTLIQHPGRVLKFAKMRAGELDGESLLQPMSLDDIKANICDYDEAKDAPPCFFCHPKREVKTRRWWAVLDEKVQFKRHHETKEKTVRGNFVARYAPTEGGGRELLIYCGCGGPHNPKSHLWLLQHVDEMDDQLKPISYFEPKDVPQSFSFEGVKKHIQHLLQKKMNRESEERRRAQEQEDWLLNRQIAANREEEKAAAAAAAEQKEFDDHYKQAARSLFVR